MPAAASLSERPAAIRVDLGAIFVSMELSRSKWLITSLSPGGGQKMSKHMVAGGDLAALLNLFAALQAKARARTSHNYRTVVIQEAGLDGFWIHRALESEGIESHVVDPVSIATSRRKKRAKTDRIDGEALVRALLAYKRGEPRVCSMVRPPSPEEEDRRRLVGERKALITERIRHSNRIKGLLFAQGISKCAETDERGSQRCAPATAASCRRTCKRRSPASWIVSSYCSSNSRRWRPSGMLCSLGSSATPRRQPACS